MKMRSVVILALALCCGPASRIWAGGTVYGVRDGLPHPSVTAASLDQGWLWVGTERGLAVLPPGQEKFKAFPDFTENVSAVVGDNGSAWVGTPSGLLRADGTKLVLEDLRARGGIPQGGVRLLRRDLEGAVWLGTDTGLALLPAGQSSWQTINLPAGIAGPVRAVTPSGSLCYVGAATPDLLILDQDSRRWLRRPPPQNEVAITAITVYGPYVYAGTDGQGIFRFDWGNNLWTKLYPKKPEGNSFILCAAASGSRAWFGTFEQLLQIDQAAGTLAPADLGADSGAATTLNLAGAQLLVGGEKGLALIPLSEPRVACEPRRSILLAPRGEIEFTGLAQSPAGIKQISVAFAVQPLPGTWFTRNLSLVGPDAHGRLHGTWKVDDLPSPSDFYLLRVTAEDKLGGNNNAISQIIIAPQEPSLAFAPVEETLNEGLQTLTGSFNTPFAAEITVEPGDVRAQLDRNAGKFQATLNLMPGNNRIRASLTDWFGRRAQTASNVQAAAGVAPETAVMVTTAESGEQTLTLNEVLLFDTASVEIKPSGYAALGKVVDYLNRDERLQATIVGHTDNVPIQTRQFPDNQVLSKARAKSVFDYLVKQKGIAAQRLTILGLGDSRPLASNKTAEGRAKNRRVEIVVKHPEATP